MNNTRLLLSVLLVAMFAAGCNTAKGLGSDMQQTGQNIKETVEKND